MPMAPRRPCSHHRCSRLAVTRGRCERHQPRPLEDDRPNADVRTWYRSDRWRALRLAVLRAEPFCPDCAAIGMRVATTDADHRVPHRGDPALFWSRENLQGKCHVHHSQKTGQGQ